MTCMYIFPYNIKSIDCREQTGLTEFFVYIMLCKFFEGFPTRRKVQVLDSVHQFCFVIFLPISLLDNTRILLQIISSFPRIKYPKVVSGNWKQVLMKLDGTGATFTAPVFLCFLSFLLFYFIYFFLSMSTSIALGYFILVFIPK